LPPQKLKGLVLKIKLPLSFAIAPRLKAHMIKYQVLVCSNTSALPICPTISKKINALLRDRGILMNHGISRKVKKDWRAAKRIRPERRLLLKYIFPGSELDNVGHTFDTMELSGFEVHDVEAWREHYALTTRHWYRELMKRKDEAIGFVGEEKFRMWALYLAGVSIGFADGSIHICQVVATKRASKGPSRLPLTRADLYQL